jgi:NADH-quinone oxidoreductase subunit G
VTSIAPFATRGLTKIGGTLVVAEPGGEAAALDGLHGQLPTGSVILVGERLATSPGAYSAAIRLAEATDARLGWVPRRAGDRGALEAGAAPNLLPGGRPLADPAARTEVATGWHVDELPDAPGRDTSSILAAATDGTLEALLIGGVELDDLPDPGLALAAVETAPFVVSLELRHSAVTERADVVFPVAPVTEKSGTFVNWEGRQRPFEPALPPNATADVRVLAALADEVGVDLALPDAAAVRAELAKLGSWQGSPAAAPDVTPPQRAQPSAGQAVLAGWRLLLDAGRLQDGEPHLAGTARATVVRLSEATAAEIGSAEGELVNVSTPSGAISLPLEITDMPDRVVWLPLNSPGSAVAATLGASVGDLVSISEGGQGA